MVQSNVLVTRIFASDENFQATPEFVRALVIFDFRGMRAVLHGSFDNGKTGELDQFVPGFEGSTAFRNFCLESFGQQLQQLCIYLSRYDLLVTFVGFQSHLCQLKGSMYRSPKVDSDVNL